MGLSESFSVSFPSRYQRANSSLTAVTDNTGTLAARRRSIARPAAQSIQNGRAAGIVFRGTLLATPSRLSVLVERFKALGYTPAMQREATSM